jgi:signal transduction histidine kinase
VDVRRLEQAAIVAGTLTLVLVPTVVHGWPRTWTGNLAVATIVVAGLALAWWRTHARVVSVLALGLLLLAASLDDAWVPDSAIGFLAAGCAVLALAWSGRAAWLVALCAAAYVVALDSVAHIESWVAAVMFTVPPFVAGTVLRLRQETTDELARRMAELEEERELFTQLALQHERTRIAGELHDIVGHAISVMVIQAAAGQRLVDSDPDRTREAFAAISESARQGQQDVQRLVELLGGSGVRGPDLSLVDEVVSRARRSGLSVSCRFEGDRDGVSEPVAHLAFRVVQESLTNALRYAPGAEVRIAIGVDEPGRTMTVRVENGAPAGEAPSVEGSGRGLLGLRERVQALGGQVQAGATRSGGWAVEAQLPGS